MATYTITGNGKLFVSGQTLAFYDAESEKKAKIPVKSADAIVVTGRVGITSDVFRILSRDKILLVYAPKGRLEGVFIPRTVKTVGTVHIAQARAYADEKERAEIARLIETYGAEHGTMEHTRIASDEAAKTAVERYARAESVNEIMGYEGEFYKAYYSALDDALPQKFQLGGREYHPPPNRGNAVVSYINSLMYANLLSALVSAGLDTAISYIHEPRHGPISLALDFAEMYRPALISRTFLSAIAKYKLSEGEFYVDGRGWYLQRSGRRKVAMAFEEQYNRIVVAEGRRRKFSTVVLRNAHALRRYFEGKNKSPKFLKFSER